MSDALICAEGLGKKYVIGHHAQRERYTALRDVIARGAKSLFRKTSDLAHGRAVIEGDELEEIWALKGVSFEVNRGEVLGIIGRNGAGKSTLLKILSRITEPSAGRVTLRGRVASLLEVGTGFHPELSGRENIFLNGAILGMTRTEIRERFDEIVAFAEVERYLDTPVKRYSSGMYVRLAFAVAAHLEPEILVVDEVLAVGDAEFQRKCLGKLKDVSQTRGRAVLFVSHNMSAIQSLCSRALLLRGGSLAESGKPEAVVGAYLAGFAGQSHAGLGPVRQISAALVLDALEVRALGGAGSGLQFSLRFSALEAMRMTELSVLFYSRYGSRVGILDLRTPGASPFVRPGAPLGVEGRIHNPPLVEGDYLVGLYLNCGDFRGDVYDLTTCSIGRSAGRAGIAPYAPSDRGVVEFEYEFRYC